ncbi:kinase-like domain-containing protein [Mycena galericulata]|nr:kinase-like domain-containing protein [Mycena galericulata]
MMAGFMPSWATLKKLRLSSCILGVDHDRHGTGQNPGPKGFSRWLQITEGEHGSISHIHREMQTPSQEMDPSSNPLVSPSLTSTTVDHVDRLIATWRYLKDDLGQPHHMETVLCHSLQMVLDSPVATRVVMDLSLFKAQLFLDSIQDVLNHGTLPTAWHATKARTLLMKLSEKSDQLPTSFFISGVSNADQHPTFCGGFGDVYRASYDGGLVALKRIRRFAGSSSSTKDRSKFCREALVWQNLQHPFILPFLGIDRETFPSALCLVSPWMSNGTVLEYLGRSGKSGYPQNGLMVPPRVILEIVMGLEYLHSMNIVHGDLRGNNILISDDFHVCLADFGLTTTIVNGEGDQSSSSNRAGSMRWFAPELIDPLRFGVERFVRTRATDIYAFACVCIELHTGKPPFAKLTEAAVIFKIVQGERPERPETMTDTVWKIVTATWAENRMERLPTHPESLSLYDRKAQEIPRLA